MAGADETSGAVEFSFRLTGSGWARARLAHGSERVDLPASYLSDVLGEVLLAIAELQDGEEAAVASWEQEPANIGGCSDRTDGEVSLHVLAIKDSYPRLFDDDGSVVFTPTCPVDELARAFAKGARSVLYLEGEEGYKQKWVEDPFPTALLEMVESRLAAQQPQ